MADRAPRRLLIRGGRCIDRAGERVGDVLIESGNVAAVGEALTAPRGATVLDATGCVVAPGLVDLHTHLREPGGERAETIESGTRAAGLGGYTAVVAMPNTTPVIDNAAVVREVLELAEGACCAVGVAGAITVGRAGSELAPYAEMAALGVRLFTDDGSGVQDPLLMRRALEYARDLGVVLAEHCEDARLAAGGLMHEGAWSERLGVPGQPALAEEAMLERDLALVALTGTPMHFLHLSTARSVALVRAAKQSGLAVTAEVTPHHLSLTDERLAGFDPVFKVNPPLRTEADIAALRQGLRDGTIDAIATDHAPHPAESKEAPLSEAAPGMIGLETALAVAHTVLVATAEPTLDLAGLFACCSFAPANIAGLAQQTGLLEPGRPAHVVVFDPTATWTVEPELLASRSANTPFAGWRLTGRVRHTVYDGEPVVIDARAQR